jgi:hypothetical protein
MEGGEEKQGFRVQTDVLMGHLGEESRYGLCKAVETPTRQNIGAGDLIYHVGVSRKVTAS